jgi:hypothetical protein
MGHQPDAKTAAVIGFGSGMSTAMLLGSPRITRVDSIEIEPAMIEGARLFRPAVDAAYADPRSHIVIDDAKSFFARGGARYDIIVSEPSNPWVSGVASLFTEEFYARLALHLNEGGVLSQWLHTYDMDAPTLASIIHAVGKTFPEFVIYSSIDSDIILVARKGMAPGQFDPDVLRFERLQPVLERLKLADPEVVRRRAVAGSAVLDPFLRTYGAPANSDFFPIVDQRSAKARFTLARVNELTDLRGSSMPILEMFGGGPYPSRERHEAMRSAFIEVATDEAWRLHDEVVGAGPARRPGGEPTVRELAAREVRSWSMNCRGVPEFDRILPSLISVAEFVNPFLHPTVAMQVWQLAGDSPCARLLPETERRWLDLIEAVAQRDAGRMAARGGAILESVRGSRSPVSEYAFFATATALACQGETVRVRDLLREARRSWVRDGVGATELRLLEAMSAAPPGAARRDLACVAGSSPSRHGRTQQGR